MDLTTSGGYRCLDINHGVGLLHHLQASKER